MLLNMDLIKDVCTLAKGDGVKTAIEFCRYHLWRRRLQVKGEKLSQEISIAPMEYPIDFVVTWVDGNDPEWQRVREPYARAAGIQESSADNGKQRYRDWDIFKYWFRAVEKYAPWVQNVYLVTCGQVPDWMSLDAPKLKLINHAYYIQEEHLPTFNSGPLEINLHRIKSLSEHFVYFNDDMFLGAPVKPEDFFRGGLPNYAAIARPSYYVPNNTFAHHLFSAICEVNRHFRWKVRQIMCEHPEKWFASQYGKDVKYNLRAFEENYLPAMCFSHLGISFRKSTMKRVWEAMPDVMNTTSSHRFRDAKDISMLVFSFWEMMENQFNAVSEDHFGKYFNLTVYSKDEIVDTILSEKYRMYCLNDSDHTTDDDYIQMKKLLVETMEKVFPQKSSFEK